MRNRVVENKKIQSESVPDTDFKVLVVGTTGHGKSRHVDDLLSRAAENSVLTNHRFHSGLRGYRFVQLLDQDAVPDSLASGTVGADAAILVVDLTQSASKSWAGQAHALHLLGVDQVVVVINKTDPADLDAARFTQIAQDIAEYFARIGAPSPIVVPATPGHDDGPQTVSEKQPASEKQAASETMPWYDGPFLLDVLDGFLVEDRTADSPLRFPIQEIIKSGDHRILTGQIESGCLRLGERLLFSPSNKIAQVRTIEAVDDVPGAGEARAGQTARITLSQPLFIEPGEVASHEESAPQLSTVFRANMAWFGGAPLEVGKTYRIRLATQEAMVTVQSVEKILDPTTLAAREGDTVEAREMTEVVLRSRRILVLDEFRSLPRMGRFVLTEADALVATGAISMEGYPDQRGALEVKSTNVTNVEHRVPASGRAQRNGHRGGVLWLTGLSGAGKSTLAMEVEQRLFQKGYHVYVLDGDNVRRGLNANLGFAPDDRAENIRRVGEVAALFADAGFICITAFISPYQADRDRARSSGKGIFHEIYVQADLETCERRDPKGLYRKARKGEIADFTGVSAPYEAPAMAELTVDTAQNSVEECVARILEYVTQQFVLSDSAEGLGTNSRTAGSVAS